MWFDVLKVSMELCSATRGLETGANAPWRNDVDGTLMEGFDVWFGSITAEIY